MPNLEDVFKRSGVPTHTFVEPKEYNQLVVSLRTPGRGVILEGPSGIGKTTAVETALRSLKLDDCVTKLSARKPADIDYISGLPELGELGVVIVDDFHKLNRETQEKLADYIKILADISSKESKIVLIGINQAGQSLINLAPDVTNRVDIIRLENNSDERVQKILELGEDALNININVKEEIVQNAQGSFYITQMLAYEVCLRANVLESANDKVSISESLEAVKASLHDRLGQRFRSVCEKFCRGTRFRRDGRAPYLHMLYWLATQPEWTLDLRAAMREHQEMRGSVGQVIDKGFLQELVDGNSSIQEVLHYDEDSELITVEDPQFVFYLKGVPWRSFSKEIGFTDVDFEYRYDFALSFAGSDRDVAHILFEKLQDQEMEVFYDFNEQHRILAEDIEDYLRPIYESDSQFIVCLLGPDYPRRAWTRVESEAFKVRFSESAIIPLLFSNAAPGIFDEAHRRGAFMIDRDKEIEPQVTEFVGLLTKKIREIRKV